MTIQTNELQGVYPALMTHMHENGRISYEAIYQHINDLIRADVHGIVACGTTGQSCTLSHDEHIEVAVNTYRCIGEVCQFIAGAGSNCTKEAVNLTNGIEAEIGPQTFLHITPYYNKPPHEGMLNHFRTILDAMDSESNLIIYNVPGRTGRGIETKTVLELAEHPQVIGLKQAHGDMKQLGDIIRGTRNLDFRVLAGEDHLVAKMMDEGAYGVISASANIAPVPFRKLVNCILNYNLTEEAYVMQKHVMPIVEAVFCESNPIPLAHMFNSGLRSPLVKIERVQEHVDEVLSNYSSKELGINVDNYKNRERSLI